jgi:hypothetical protein
MTITYTVFMKAGTHIYHHASILFIPCFANGLQIHTVQTDAQLRYYVLHCHLDATCFVVNAIISQLTPTLLKLTATKQSYNAYAAYI